jgi:hypothetical protein
MKLNNEGAICNHASACGCASKDLLNILCYVLTGLQWSQWPLACLDCGFESHGGHECLLWVLCVDRGLCVGQTTLPEESYRVWFVWVWSRNLINKEPWPTRGYRATKKDIFLLFNHEKWSERQYFSSFLAFYFKYYTNITPKKFLCFSKVCYGTLF